MKKETIEKANSIIQSISNWQKRLEQVNKSLDRYEAADDDEKENIETRSHIFFSDQYHSAITIYHTENAIDILECERNWILKKIAKLEKELEKLKDE